MKGAVSQTEQDFNAEAESRNIRLIELNSVDSKLLSLATPKFTGDGSLHIFQWMETMDVH